MYRKLKFGLCIQLQANLTDELSYNPTYFQYTKSDLNDFCSGDCLDLILI